MIKQIRFASVRVRDQEKALDFYVNKLGFEKRMDEPYGEGFRWLVVAPPGAETGIVLFKPFPGACGQGDTGQLTGMVFATDDIQATFQELSARGVHFTEAPTAQPWGMQALFEDQDGNSFVLVQP